MMWRSCPIENSSVDPNEEKSYGIKKREAFAPVARYESLRLQLVLATIWDSTYTKWMCQQLNGVLSANIYMRQPMGFRHGPSVFVCKLKKSLYGLKQARRIWMNIINLPTDNFYLDSTAIKAFSCFLVSEGVNMQFIAATFLVDMTGAKFVKLMDRIAIHFTSAEGCRGKALARNSVLTSYGRTYVIDANIFGHIYTEFKLANRNMEVAHAKCCDVMATFPYEDYDRVNQFA
ncbi:Retrotransposon protein, Ty1-Copia subclass [Phytophthora megakarya]|uniref:Retrotransposon protein, Ty1-Copia subclass n=1 Tax=Phytophthora megakarya TaxID=4795 RepID=A0A225WD28_9STRA|nr:Retrotransposon protein, Ty1-Copia subclass [Phytophthora megakarya]